jgi:glycosyltransferase involved in cell wall biosynthesis
VAVNRTAAVDVVVPVYNEERDLPRNIPVLRDFLSGDVFPYAWRIVIGDNGSTDGTEAAARELEAKYPGEVTYYRASGKGKGLVIKEAWLASEADVVAFMDVDLSSGIEAFPELVGAVLGGGYDIAIGSRAHAKSKVKRSLQRRTLTWGYNLLVKSLFGVSFGDAQCGFKAANREAAQRLLPLVKDGAWFFDSEFLILAEKLKYRIREVPVNWVEDESTSVKLANTIADDLRGLLRMRLGRPWRNVPKRVV